MTAPDDHDKPTIQLLARARGGDVDAYDRLFELAAERLQLFLRVRLGPDLRRHEESRDLLQETYLAAHQAFGQFESRGPGSFSRWLCQIAENQIRARVDYHGAKKRRAGAELERVSRVVDRITAGGIGMVTHAHRVEQRSRLAAAMAELPKTEREALLMRHFEGREITAIAETLGVSATSARRLIGCATVLLGDVLKGEGGVA